MFIYVMIILLCLLHVAMNVNGTRFYAFLNFLS